MALSAVETPAKWSSVYKPMVFGVISDRFPNRDPRTTNITIYEIRLPKDSELSAYPTLLPTDVVVIHDYVDPSAFYAGQTMTIEGTTGGYYDGVVRLLSRPDGGLSVISSTYIADDTGGLFGAYLNNYTVFYEVTADGKDPVILRSQPFEITDTRHPFVGQTLFECDVREIVQRSMTDVFEVIESSDTYGIMSADGRIANGYTVRVWDGWDVTTESGTTFDQDTTRLNTLILTNYRGVNAVQPMHRTDIDGDITLDFDDELTGYLLSRTSTGKKFLTYQNSGGTVIRADEPGYLAFLWDDKNTTIRLNITQYTSAGSVIGTTTTTATAPKYAAIVPCGPAAFTLSANCAYYRVGIFDGVNQLSETFRFNITTDCEEANRRMYWLNKLGGVDAFTFIGREDLSVSVRRSAVSKPDMYNWRVNTEYQRRVVDVDIQREYTLQSGWLRPEAIKHLAEDFAESPNVRTVIRDDWWTEVIVLSDTVAASSTNKINRRFSFIYTLGVDNLSQRR